MCTRGCVLVLYVRTYVHSTDTDARSQGWFYLEISLARCRNNQPKAAEKQKYQRNTCSRLLLCTYMHAILQCLISSQGFVMGGIGETNHEIRTVFSASRSHPSLRELASPPSEKRTIVWTGIYDMKYLSTHYVCTPIINCCDSCGRDNTKEGGAHTMPYGVRIMQVRIWH